MTAYKTTPITLKVIRIEYSHSQYHSDYGWPYVRVLWNNKVMINKEANGQIFEFTVDDFLDTNTLAFEHYGKNHVIDNDKFFQIDKIFINNVDLCHITQECKFDAIMPPWEEQDSIEIIGNTYMGWNGKLVYTFENPIMLDIQKRLGRTVTQMEGQETSRDVLNHMKNYFFSD